MPSSSRICRFQSIMQRGYVIRFMESKNSVDFKERREMALSVLSSAFPHLHFRGKLKGQNPKLNSQLVTLKNEFIFHPKDFSNPTGILIKLVNVIMNVFIPSIRGKYTIYLFDMLCHPNNFSSNIALFFNIHNVTSIALLWTEVSDSSHFSTGAQKTVRISSKLAIFLIKSLSNKIRSA